MNGNEHPSMEIWRAGEFTTWAALGEIVAALKAEREINWRRAENVALGMCHDDLGAFVRKHLEGIRTTVEDAVNSDQ